MLNRLDLINATVELRSIIDNSNCELGYKCELLEAAKLLETFATGITEMEDGTLIYRDIEEEKEELKRWVEEEVWVDDSEETCSYCSNSFTVQWDKETYIKHVCGEERRPVKCPKCGKWTMPCCECAHHNLDIDCGKCTELCEKLNKGEC